MILFSVERKKECSYVNILCQELHKINGEDKKHSFFFRDE